MTDRQTTVRDLREAVRSRARSAREICQDALTRIETVNPLLNAFNTVVADRAMARAQEIDRDPDRWRDAPLAGVPVAIKDNLCTRGVRTTASSRMLEHYLPPYDATVVSRLERAGAVVVGKTNCDEFAMGSSNENSAFGPVRNPWALDRIPGGTSGGSAAAVAAGLAPLALGSDTGGSIRQPASLCGVVGLKPTYGRVSRYGLIAHASSLDQVGPLTRTVYDAALALGVVAGEDAADATSAAETVPDYTAALTGDVRGTRIGIPRALLAGIDAEVSRAIDAALDVLRARGATIVDIELPHAKYATPVYYLVSTAEASSNLARYDGVRYGMRVDAEDVAQMNAATRAAGFGAEVKRRILVGTYVLSHGYYDAYYLQAQKVRRLIAKDFTAAFAHCDLIMGPTSPSTAFALGAKSDDPVQMYLNDIFTIPAPLAGLPGLSIPCGFDGKGLPVGLQIMGNYFAEAKMLGAAHRYQQATDWHLRAPKETPL